MYEDPPCSWALVSQGHSHWKKPPLNILYELVPERSALFSVKGVLEKFFPVSNYIHGGELSAHNEQLWGAHFACSGYPTCIMERRSQQSELCAMQGCLSLSSTPFSVSWQWRLHSTALSDSEAWSPIPSKKITKIRRFQSCEVSPYTFLGLSPFLQFWDILLTNRPFGRTHSSPLNVSSFTVSLVGLALLGGGNYGCRFRACSWYSRHKNSDLLWNSNLQASWR